MKTNKCKSSLLIEWIIQNIDWLFSGIGVVILTGIIRFLFKSKKHKTSHNLNIKSGNNSTNNQGGNNVSVTIGDKKLISGGNGSTNIQGNIVTINQQNQNGLNYQDVRQVFMDIFKSNFYDLGESATHIVKKRAEEVTNK